MNWTQPKDIKKQIQRLWDRGYLLNESANDVKQFPKRLILKPPTNKELPEYFEEVRLWIASLHNIKGLRLETKTIHHRVLGKNQIPASIWLDNLETAVKILHKEKEHQQFLNVINLTRQQNPELLDWIYKHAITTIETADQWPKLLSVVNWLKENPRPNIYTRQVDIPRIDTKFIESHKKILTALLDISLHESNIDHSATGTNRFSQRYGFCEKPARVRFRLLDPSINLLPGLNQDITITHDAFCLLNNDKRIENKIKTVFITENEINFLTFPNIKNAIVLFGAGYGFENLTNVNWLNPLEIYYWGDIDTHGFAILDQLREKLPQTVSLLMNEETLMSHKLFWGKESKPEKRELKRLSTEENKLYQQLVNHHFGEKLRLEQEKIHFRFLLDTLQAHEIR